MRSLSGMAVQAGAVVLLWTIQSSTAAEEPVSLPPVVPHASTTGALSGPEYAPYPSDVCNLRPHPYAVFWRGYCLCESMCLQAKLDRFRYPDHLRHRQYVEARAAIVGSHAAGPLAGEHCCPRCNALHARTGPLGWLGRRLLPGSPSAAVTVRDAVVQSNPKPQRNKRAEAPAEPAPSAENKDNHDSSPLVIGEDTQSPETQSDSRQPHILQPDAAQPDDLQPGDTLPIVVDDAAQPLQPLPSDNTDAGLQGTGSREPSKPAIPDSGASEHPSPEVPARSADESTPDGSAAKANQGLEMPGTRDLIPSDEQPWTFPMPLGSEPDGRTGQRMASPRTDVAPGRPPQNRIPSSQSSSARKPSSYARQAAFRQLFE